MNEYSDSVVEEEEEEVSAKEEEMEEEEENHGRLQTSSPLQSKGEMLVQGVEGRK